MKTLNLSFEDKEFNKLKKIKKQVNSQKRERKEKPFSWEKLISFVFKSVWNGKNKKI